MALLQIAVHRAIHSAATRTTGALLRDRLRRGVHAVRRDVVDDHPAVLAQSSRDLGVAQERRRGRIVAFDHG
jgi:hypothetical protein